MSLLDDGPDRLLAFPEVAGTDSDGNPTRVPSGVGITVLGRIQPVSSAESATDGQEVRTTYRFKTRSFPAGAFSRVEWDGRTWDVIGEPLRSNGSERTRHVTVLLSAREPQAL